jgi:hypothetical protein
LVTRVIAESILVASSNAGFVVKAWCFPALKIWLSKITGQDGHSPSQDAAIFCNILKINIMSLRYTFGALVLRQYSIHTMDSAGVIVLMYVFLFSL